MKYKYLEYLRASAAIAVFIGHIIGKLPRFQEKQFSFLHFACWGAEAVIVFFLLSGVVINHVAKKYKQNTQVFLKNRAIRILPIYYTCVFLALGIDFLVKCHPILLKDFLGTIFFVATLQEIITHPMETISTVWSLSFEVFFYIVFSFTIGKNQKKALLLWTIVAIISVFLFYTSISETILLHLILMLSFSSLWLFGYFIYEYKDQFKTNFSTSIFAFSIIPLINRLQISPYYYDIIIYLLTAFVCVPIFIFALNCGQNPLENQKYQFRLTHLVYIPIYLVASFISLKYSKSLLINRIMYLSVPLISLILLNKKIEKFIKLILKGCEKFMLFFASISYAFYLIHMPIIYLFVKLMPSYLLLSIICIVFFSVLISYFLEFVLQKKIYRYFTKKKSI